MVGYGAEDDHFVVELTYNYGVKNYKRGNDFQVGLCMISSCVGRKHETNADKTLVLVHSVLISIQRTSWRE